MQQTILNAVLHPFAPGIFLFVVTLVLGVYGAITGATYEKLMKSKLFTIAWLGMFAVAVCRFLGVF